MKNGLSGFHDYEVIELLLSLNTPRKDCKESAKALLKRFKTFQGVLEADIPALCEIKGVGPANSLGIRLIKEVSDRFHEKKILSKDVVSNPHDLVAYLNQTIGHKRKEVFAVVFLDAKNRVLTSRILFEGTLTASSVYPREVIVSALQHNAASVILAHNHPSGDVHPSGSDIRLTRQLYFALNYSGVTLHEHMIVGGDNFFSFAEQGFMTQFKSEFEVQNAGR